MEGYKTMTLSLGGGYLTSANIVKIVIENYLHGLTLLTILLLGVILYILCVALNFYSNSLSMLLIFLKKKCLAVIIVCTSINIIQAHHFANCIQRVFSMTMIKLDTDAECLWKIDNSRFHVQYNIDTTQHTYSLSVQKIPYIGIKYGIKKCNMFTNNMEPYKQQQKCN